MQYSKSLKSLGMQDVSLVGGKAASLGQMMQQLSDTILIPDGFALTADAYWYFVDHNKIRAHITAGIEQTLDPENMHELASYARRMRSLFEQGAFPEDLKDEIVQAYQNLARQYKKRNISVAVRSSATAEDLPGASFAGQQETFLHVRDQEHVLEACKRCFASLFTERSIAYRIYKQFDIRTIALSVVVQKMVYADHASAGVAFSLDPETGCNKVITINAAFGLGEAVVQGKVDPDEYRVFKETLEQGYAAIIKKSSGNKDKKLVFASRNYRTPTKWVSVAKKQRKQFCLTDQEIIELVRMVAAIEAYYSKLHGSWMPMDIEWAQDVDRTLYIVQARPETVHAQQTKKHIFEQYVLKPGQQPQVLLQGQSIGQKIVSGSVRILKKYADATNFHEGDIIVTPMTDPDWVPLMRKAGGIITDAGGRTCHAAIVSRELGIPAIVGTDNATTSLHKGQLVTLDCSQASIGYVYQGAVSYEKQEINTTLYKAPKVPLMINSADPAQAFVSTWLPHVSGVGLARMEFIIAHEIQMHPMACKEFDRILDRKVRQKIMALASSYADKEQYFVNTLAYGIATLAAAWYPKPVIVRFSDFKTNEYRNLLGGSYFEGIEQNPMLGLRGASRYYHPSYAPAFALECAAIKKAREVLGLTNIIVMIPFVRTPEEARRVLACMKDALLERGVHDLKVYMMVEIPSNVILLDEFAPLFDGFSIGSNDLTQFTLAVDRDAQILAPLFDERDAAVKKMIQQAVEGAHRHKKPIGICGQAPSDYPELADFLMSLGIDSLSLNADAVVPFLMRS